MSERLVAMTFEEASRWIASQDRRIAALESALRTITSNGLTDLEMLDVANAALAQSETGEKQP